MSDWLPQPLINPLTSPWLLHGTDALAAGPGLLAFLPLIPLVRWWGRTRPRTAIIATSILWMFGTMGLPSVIAIVGWLTLALGLLLVLVRLRRAKLLSQRAMIALTWIGLHALAFPLWWWAYPQWFGWIPSSLAALHNAGFAYFLLRLVALGVDWARTPDLPVRLGDTAAWLFYPACMRMGPVMRREDFIAQFDRWSPHTPPDHAAAWRRFALALLGLAGFGLCGALLPAVTRDTPDYFSTPSQYGTPALVAVFYLVPVQVYLYLWSYNEIAAATSRWVGIVVPNNFDWLPRAISIKDFWRRWHITVGAWMRDYIYIPLGGNRGVVELNYLAVFVYCGVWHGASWSFFAWGVSQGLGMSVERWWEGLRKRSSWLNGWLRGPAWVLACWLLTLHYQLATIVMFADFHFLGLRLFGELGRRIFGG